MITMQDLPRSERLFTPGKAVKYLKEVHGIDIKVGTLRQWRNRGIARIEDPERIEERMTLWTQGELDTLSKTVEGRDKH